VLHNLKDHEETQIRPNERPRDRANSVWATYRPTQAAIVRSNTPNRQWVGWLLNILSNDIFQESGEFHGIRWQEFSKNFQP